MTTKGTPIQMLFMLDAEHNLLQARKIKRLSDGTLKRGSNALGLASGS